MTLFKHELRQGFKSLAVWTAAIGFFLVVCVFLYPEMENEMQDVSNMFSSMGAFTAAFGMDRLNFGELTGFYAIECGNILGLGGAFFCALLAAGVLAKEEKGGTAEFLLTHPIGRGRLLAEKLAAVFLQVTGLHLLIFALAAASIALIGEEIPVKEIGLLHLANFLAQIELACICFGVSAFLRRSGLGVGLGIAAVMYFLNILSNITEQADFLKYFTPFSYAEGADILADGCLDGKKILLGMGLAAAGICAAYWKYCRKDIL